MDDPHQCQVIRTSYHHRDLLLVHDPSPNQMNQDLPHILHGSTPACLKSNDTQISSQFQQHSV